MRAGSVAAVAMFASCASSALGQVIADFDWTLDVTVVTLADPTPPPINITQGSFFVSDELFPDPAEKMAGTSPAFGDGGSGIVDFTSSSDPASYSNFVSLFHAVDSGSMFFVQAILTDPGLGDVTVNDVSSTPTMLDELLSPEEISALSGANIQFFRLIVSDVVITNGVGNDPARADFLAHGTFQVWIPAPGGVGLAGVACLAAVRRRRR